MRVSVAVFGGHYSVVKFLFERAGDTEESDSTGRTPLMVAAQCGYLDIVDYLVMNGAHTMAVDQCGNTPLHVAAAANHVAVVHYLCNNQDVDREAVDSKIGPR